MRHNTLFPRMYLSNVSAMCVRCVYVARETINIEETGRDTADINVNEQKEEGKLSQIGEHVSGEFRYPCFTSATRNSH